jgi:hypothetical protein
MRATVELPPTLAKAEVGESVQATAGMTCSARRVEALSASAPVTPPLAPACFTPSARVAVAATTEGMAGGVVAVSEP